jgi:hypothetical protein
VGSTWAAISLSKDRATPLELTKDYQFGSAARFFLSCGSFSIFRVFPFLGEYD